MNKNSVVVVVGIIVMAIAVLAGLHWNRQTVPVNDEVPGTFAMIGVGFVAATLFGAVVRLPARKISLIVGSTLAGGVLLDAIIHFIVPPQTGGLFPFAVVALGIMGALVGLLGGLIGKGVALLLGPVDNGGGT